MLQHHDSKYALFREQPGVLRDLVIDASAATFAPGLMTERSSTVTAPSRISAVAWDRDAAKPRCSRSASNRSLPTRSTTAAACRGRSSERRVGGATSPRTTATSIVSCSQRILVLFSCTSTASSTRSERLQFAAMRWSVQCALYCFKTARSSQEEGLGCTRDNCECYD